MVHYMGLIKAIGGAIRGTMADQWKEYFYCDSMDADVLVTKGTKRVKGMFGTKNSGSDNIITNGSVIPVNEGQRMNILEHRSFIDRSLRSVPKPDSSYMIHQQNQVYSAGL